MIINRLTQQLMYNELSAKNSPVGPRLHEPTKRNSCRGRYYRTERTVLDLSTIYARAYQHRNSRNVRRARSESEIVFSLILLVVYTANDQTPYSARQIVGTIQYFSLAIVWAQSGCGLTARTP